MSTTLRKHEMFIGGEWTPGAGKDAQEIVNPATGKVIGDDATRSQRAIAQAGAGDRGRWR